MNVAERFFEAPDGAFHYLDWGGEGPLAHFSHATGLCASTYTPLVKLLCRHLKVVGMDDRGHGRTRAAADPRRLKSWDTFAEDLERFFEHLGRPLVAMGHSRGAVASLLLAVRRPDLVKALVLVDPTILPLSWMWWWYLAKKTGVARRVPIAATAARRRYVWPDRAAILESYRSKPAFRSWQEGFLEGYIAQGTQSDGNGRIRLSCKPAWESKAFASCSHDVWGHIRRLEQPTLVVYGNKSDTFLPPAVRRFAKSVPQAEMLGFEDADHFVPMERPREVAEAIVGFLTRSGILP